MRVVGRRHRVARPKNKPEEAAAVWEAFGAEVHAPTSHAAAAFLSDRKLQLVNGMHTTLAFSTMRRFNADEPGDLPLGRPRDFDGGELDRWASRPMCRHHRRRHGVPVIMDAFDAATEADAFDALEQYARTCLQRFDDAPDDTVARVLGGGVAHRWRGRLAATEGDLARALQSNAAAQRFPARYTPTQRGRDAGRFSPREGDARGLRARRRQKSTNRGGRRGLDSLPSPAARAETPLRIARSLPPRPRRPPKVIPTNQVVAAAAFGVADLKAPRRGPRPRRRADCNFCRRRRLPWHSKPSEWAIFSLSLGLGGPSHFRDERCLPALTYGAFCRFRRLI